jgi:hypothetical protein
MRYERNHRGRLRAQSRRRYAEVQRKRREAPETLFFVKDCNGWTQALHEVDTLEEAIQQTTAPKGVLDAPLKRPFIIYNTDSIKTATIRRVFNP